MKDLLLNFGRQPVKVDVPEIPEAAVYVKSLTAGERLVLQQLQKDGEVIGDHEFVFLGACDEKGTRLFTPDEAKNLNGKLANRIARAVVQASYLEDAETPAKNSVGSPS